MKQKQNSLLSLRIKSHSIGFHPLSSTPLFLLVDRSDSFFHPCLFLLLSLFEQSRVSVGLPPSIPPYLLVGRPTFSSVFRFT